MDLLNTVSMSKRAFVRSLLDDQRVFRKAGGSIAFLSISQTEFLECPHFLTPTMMANAKYNSPLYARTLQALGS
jgi:hypothetical protein